MVFDLLFHFIILNCLSTDSSCIFKCFLGWILRFMTFYSFFVEIASRPDTRVAKLISTRRMSIFLISSMLILFLKSSFFTPTGFKRILIYDSRDRMMRQGKTLTDCRFRIGNMLLVTLKFENKKN